MNQLLILQDILLIGVTNHCSAHINKTDLHQDFYAKKIMPHKLPHPNLNYTTSPDAGIHNALLSLYMFTCSLELLPDQK